MSPMASVFARACTGALAALLIASTAQAASTKPATQAPKVNQAEMECLAKAIYFEARGEPLDGQRAVAEVILNRVESPRFPATVCAVVTQGNSRGCQFSYHCNGRSKAIRERAAYSRAVQVATAALSGQARALTDGATYFHTPAVRPAWSRKFVRTARIGRHIFYRQDQRVASN